MKLHLTLYILHNNNLLVLTQHISWRFSSREVRMASCTEVEFLVAEIFHVLYITTVHINEQVDTSMQFCTTI